MEYKVKYTLVAIVVIGFIGIVFFSHNLSTRTEPQGDSVAMAPVSPQIRGENKFYKNLLLGFSVLFPKSLSVKEYGKGNTSTIVFENEEGGKEGFQVFVVPYGEQQVSQERFKMDVPLGVMLQPTDVIIDGVRATMFFGKDVVFGDTREVWFIKNSFLYEVTTYKELDTWLAGIMQTWHFLSK